MPTPFGLKLHAARQALGMTQAQVGELVGRDHNTVARYERGERVPEPLVQEAILARLKAQKRKETP